MESSQVTLAVRAETSPGTAAKPDCGTTHTSEEKGLHMISNLHVEVAV